MYDSPPRSGVVGQRRRTGDSILVLEVNGKSLAMPPGFSPQPWTYQGEIYEFYLAPIYQGLGLAAFEACRSAMDERRIKGLICWALAENTPAIEFYWRRGGRPIAKAYDRIGGAKLEKIAFAWN